MSQPHLTRTLHLRDLIFMGIVIIQPTAPMPLFGVVAEEARGHVVTAILIGMLGMLCTAVSYGRMARAYPSAGSAYTYVGQEIHPALGYLTGWSMLMDYVLNPVICTTWCAKAALNLNGDVPFGAYAVFFACLFTWLNLRKIHTTAQTTKVMTAVMGVVIVWMLGATVKYLLGLPTLDAARFLKPFYDPATFSIAHVSTGTSLAVLTYIGFDAISTLSEETVNPRRNILWGTVLVCLIVGVLSAVEVYAAQLVWPFGEKLPDLDTAYVHIAGRAGGPWLFQAVNLTLLLATVGSGSGALMAGARLLYGMGRDNGLPRRFFAAVDEKSGVPRNNVLLIGSIGLIGAFTLSYQQGAELLNFGAFVGFMGVNIAAFKRYWLRAEKRRWSDFVLPLGGFLICFYLWLNLNPFAKMWGGAWLAFGVIYGWWKTNGFQNVPKFEEAK